MIEEGDGVERQYRNCKSKKAYDKKGALTAKNFYMKHGHNPFDIYHCPVCGMWHLTKAYYGQRIKR